MVMPCAIMIKSLLSMKKKILALLFLFVAPALHAQGLFVGTYNVRYQNDDDLRKGNGWPARVRVMCGLLNFEQPDIFGTQEAKAGQVSDLLAGLDGYDYIGVGRDDGKAQGEYSAIFYRKDRVRLLDGGHFWLSEHPDRPGLGWDAACVRICTWGKFMDLQGGEPFFFFNLHMDHVGVVARRESAKLVISRIKAVAGEGAAVVLTGDFNVDQHDEVYRLFAESGLLQDSYTLARHRFAENGTFVDYDVDRKTDSRIDHVFVSRAFEVDRYAILTDGYWTPREADCSPGGGGRHYVRRLPSDHYPVFVRLRRR